MTSDLAPEATATPADPPTTPHFQPYRHDGGIQFSRLIPVGLLLAAVTIGLGIAYESTVWFLTRTGLRLPGGKLLLWGTMVAYPLILSQLFNWAGKFTAIRSRAKFTLLAFLVTLMGYYAAWATYGSIHLAIAPPADHLHLNYWNPVDLVEIARRFILYGEGPDAVPVSDPNRVRVVWIMLSLEAVTLLIAPVAFAGRYLKMPYFPAHRCWGHPRQVPNTWWVTDPAITADTIAAADNFNWMATLRREDGVGTLFFDWHLPERLDAQAAYLTVSMIAADSPTLSRSRAKRTQLLNRVLLDGPTRSQVEAFLAAAVARSTVAATIAAPTASVPPDSRGDRLEPGASPAAAGAIVAPVVPVEKAVAAAQSVGADPHYLARMMARQAERQAADAQAGTKIKIPPQPNPPKPPPDSLPPAH